MSWSGLLKFFTGFTLAIALLFFAGVNVTRYLITRLTAPPPRPTFPNDSPTPAASPAQAANSPKPSTTASQPAASAQPNQVFATPSPSPSEPGAYEARVTESIGLVLRQDPSQDAERLGGVEYNQEITVLETSSDGEWIRVRLADSDTEGWIKAGNVEKVD